MFPSDTSRPRWSLRLALAASFIICASGVASKSAAAVAPGTPVLVIEPINGLRFGDYEPGSMNNLHLVVRNKGTARATNVVVTATFSGPPETTPQVRSVYSQYRGTVFPCSASGYASTCVYPSLGGIPDMRTMQMSLSNLPLTLDCRNQTATVTLTTSADGVPTVSQTLQLPISCPKTADVFVRDFQLSTSSAARGGIFTARVTVGEVEGPLLENRSATDPWIIFHLVLPEKTMRLVRNTRAPRTPPLPGANRCEPWMAHNEIYCTLYRTIGAPPITLDLPIAVASDAGCGPVTLRTSANAYMVRSIPDPNTGNNAASATVNVTGCQE
jgi:hypothetical protein